MKKKRAVGAGAAVLAVAAGWSGRLARLVISVRVRAFAAVNGGAGVPVPGPLLGADRFREVYAHPAARGRGRGSKLADLIWYWVSPGAHVHQEQVECGRGYEELAHCTRMILARPRGEIEALARRCAAKVLDELAPDRSHRVRLRNVLTAVAAEIFHELVLATPCPPAGRLLITRYSDDFLDALKCSRPRSMRRRTPLTRYLRDHLDHGTVPHPLPTSLTVEDRVLYLQSNFFGTGVGQLAEATSHLLLALAHHPGIQHRLVAAPDDTAYADRVLDESLRLYPQFGIAQRITTDDITLDDGTTVSAGSVLCFNYLAYHRSGWRDPDRFDPDRWAHRPHETAAFAPFGVTANRPCPARGLAPVMIYAITTEVLSRYTLHSSASHTRSLPNRAPCLLLPRTPTGSRPPCGALARMRLRDLAEDVCRSLAQLAFGAVALIRARRLKLCYQYHLRGDGRSGPG